MSANRRGKLRALVHAWLSDHPLHHPFRGDTLACVGQVLKGLVDLFCG